MMMSLGLFVFSLPTLAYQDLQTRLSWRHPSSSRVGARPASQFVGLGDESMTLSGCLVPELGGDPNALATLQEMGDLGEAQPLVSGLGEILGDFVIDSMDITKKAFFEDGVARSTDFTLSMHRVDDPADAGENETFSL